jgi:leader peptidase (prepilin peptidase)/N-methyltransferase
MDSILGILFGGGSLYLVIWVYYLITGKEGMGGGDIKLLAMIGAFLGWKSIPLVIFLSALVGAVSGTVYIIAQKGNRKMAIPYGPFLSFAAMIYIFYGNGLIDWYIKLISA